MAWPLLLARLAVTIGARGGVRAGARVAGGAAGRGVVRAGARGLGGAVGRQGILRRFLYNSATSMNFDDRGTRVRASYRRVNYKALERSLEQQFAQGVIQALRTPPNWPRGPVSNRKYFPIPSGFRFEYDRRNRQFTNPAPYFQKVENQGRYVERTVRRFARNQSSARRTQRALRQAGF